MTLTEDASISTDLTIEPGQDVHIIGDPDLSEAPSWGSGGFAVAERAQLLLKNLVLGESSTLEFVGSGGTIRLASLALPSGACFNSLADSMKTREGTTLELLAVTSPGISDSWSSTTTSNGQGAMSYSGTEGLFAVVSGPCATSQDGRCVGRRYSEQEPWPNDDSPNGFGPVAERCEIVVLGAGTLGPSPLFDTVSYGPHNGGQFASNSFAARHDAVGLGGASCAPAECTGNSRPGNSLSCFVSSDFGLADPVAPAGCYAGTSGPPPGTMLAVGEVLTWAAKGDFTYAHNPSYGAATNRGSAHGGWEICFVRV